MIRRLTLLLAIPAAMLPLPAQARKSQRATVMQAIGATEVTIVCNRPAADADRALLNLHWGETVVQVPLAVTS
jgi:hypothetical protein